MWSIGEIVDQRVAARAPEWESRIGCDALRKREKFIVYYRTGWGMDMLFLAIAIFATWANIGPLVVVSFVCAAIGIGVMFWGVANGLKAKRLIVQRYGLTKRAKRRLRKTELLDARRFDLWLSANRPVRN